LEEMFATGEGPEAIIQAKGLQPIQDTAALTGILDEVLAEHPEVIAKIKSGEKRPMDFLIGQVMKKTRGKADPKKVRNILRKKMSG
jgi:aspartyl-tRNA(Asn)/glutamyl-tRNA(Gln) amidotransferase subunit B